MDTSLHLAYHDRGEGLPLILLHGFGEHSFIWEGFAQRLDGLRIICPDLPGFGDTPDAEGPLSMADMADAIATLLDDLDIERGVLVGHSMGGYVALAFAARHPQRLLGLGLFHSQPFADSAEKIEARRRSIAFVRQHGTGAFVKTFVPGLYAPGFENPHQIARHQFLAAQYSSAAIIAATEAMIGRQDHSDTLRRAACPVLFIVGEADQAIPREASLAQTQLPPVADIHILPGIGHMGMVEAEAATARIVQAFVQFCRENPPA